MLSLSPTKSLHCSLATKIIWSACIKKLQWLAMWPVAVPVIPVHVLWKQKNSPIPEPFILLCLMASMHWWQLPGMDSALYMYEHTDEHNLLKMRLIQIHMLLLTAEGPWVTPYTTLKSTTTQWQSPWVSTKHMWSKSRLITIPKWEWLVIFGLFVCRGEIAMDSPLWMRVGFCSSIAPLAMTLEISQSRLHDS